MSPSGSPLLLLSLLRLGTTAYFRRGPARGSCALRALVSLTPTLPVPSLPFVSFVIHSTQPFLPCWQPTPVPTLPTGVPLVGRTPPFPPWSSVCTYVCCCSLFSLKPSTPRSIALILLRVRLLGIIAMATLIIPAEPLPCSYIL